jgi:hypothetical protein
MLLLKIARRKFFKKRDPSVYDVFTASRFFFGKTYFWVKIEQEGTGNAYF